MKDFLSLQEIMGIYCISRKLVRDILRHYRVDCYKQEDEIYIQFKEFHSIYTTKYNPVLFTVEEKKETIKPIIESKINKTFFNIFTEPVDYHHKNFRKVAMTYTN